MVVVDRSLGRCGWAAVVVLAGTVRAALGGVVADSVVEYVPGTISSSSLQQNANAALGLPASVDDGETSPFTPPFHASAITIVGAGGHVTLHLSGAITPGAGAELGVFTNTGLVATTVNGATVAKSSTTTGAAVFSTDAAIVSVSSDGSAWTALNGGNAIDLTMPSNAFTDATLTSSGGIAAVGGTAAADPFLPFTGTLGQFAGLTYPQMEALLGGSFGGAWVDVSSAGLGAVNYVRFDVPTGSRLVLDAVTGAEGATGGAAVPEPASLGVLGIGAGLLVRRRRRADF